MNDTDKPNNILDLVLTRYFSLLKNDNVKNSVWYNRFNIDIINMINITLFKNISNISYFFLRSEISNLMS